MSQQNHDAIVENEQKAAWTTPAIETYDVAEFTLASTGGPGDFGNNQS